MDRCAMCRSTDLGRGTTELSRTVDGIKFTSTVEALTCNECSESSVDADILGEFELRVAGRLAELGRATAASFKFIRKALGMRGVDAARLLGVEPETVSRWENGARALDKADFLLLGLVAIEEAESSSRTRDILHALHHRDSDGHPELVRLEYVSNRSVDYAHSVEVFFHAWSRKPETVCVARNESLMPPQDLDYAAA